MSKEGGAHKPPPVEDLAVRIRPARRTSAFWTWVNARGPALLAGFGAVVFLGVAYLALREQGSFARRRIEFPPLPQVNAAIAAAQERLKVDPQDLNALVELGTLNFEKGKEFYPEAINQLEDARELGALDARIFYCLGVMYQELGLYSFSLDEYKKYLRHHPDDKEVRMLVAKLLYKRTNYGDAVAEYERLKFHHPGDSLIEENLGLSLWGAKLTERAVESFNTLKGMGDEQAKRASFYLGQIAFEQGDAKTALEHLLQAQPEGQGYGIPAERILAATAQAYQKLGQLPEAKAAWERVLELTPDDAKAKAAVRDLNRRIPAVKKTSKT